MLLREAGGLGLANIAKLKTNMDRTQQSTFVAKYCSTISDHQPESTATNEGLKLLFECLECCGELRGSYAVLSTIKQTSSDIDGGFAGKQLE